MVVTSQESTVIPQSCYKSTATAQASLRREMALHPQLFPSIPCVLCLILCPVHGKFPVQSSCPASGKSLTHLHCEFGQTSQLHISIWHVGLGHRDSETLDSQPVGPTGLGSHPNSARKSDSTSWGRTGHTTTLEPSNPAHHKAHECPEHPADPDVHNVYNASRHQVENVSYWTQALRPKNVWPSLAVK